jgi:hypothetical protein
VAAAGDDALGPQTEEEKELEGNEGPEPAHGSEYVDELVVALPRREVPERMG